MWSAIEAGGKEKVSLWETDFSDTWQTWHEDMLCPASEREARGRWH
jgi:hypothetical protein